MKKLFVGVAIVAVASFGVYKTNHANTMNQKSDLQIENVELLAEGIETDPPKLIQKQIQKTA